MKNIDKRKLGIVFILLSLLIIVGSLMYAYIQENQKRAEMAEKKKDRQEQIVKEEVENKDAEKITYDMPEDLLKKAGGKKFKVALAKYLKKKNMLQDGMTVRSDGYLTENVEDDTKIFTLYVGDSEDQTITVNMDDGRYKFNM